MTAFSMPDTVTVGQQIDTISYFMINQAQDVTDSIATFSLIDFEGTVYVTGYADSITPSAANGQTRVEVRSQLIIPTNIQSDSRGSKYQLLWKLALVDGSIHSNSDYLTIVPFGPSTLGVQDVVDLDTVPLQLKATLPSMGNTAKVYVYKDNLQIYNSMSPVVAQGQSLEGSQFVHEFVPSMYGLQASIRPYSVIWEYPSLYSTGDREVGRLWVINPMILSAMKDLHSTINRLQREYRLPELQFQPSDFMRFLELGMDKFNGVGMMTAITMTHADGPYRYWWLVCAEIMALRTRYLEEAESSFEFSGQAVSLSVDITSYIDSIISGLEGQIDGQLVPFKKLMATKGNTSGNGQFDIRQNVIGASGLSKSLVASPGLQSVRNLFILRN